MTFKEARRVPDKYSQEISELEVLLDAMPNSPYRLTVERVLTAMPSWTADQWETYLCRKPS